MKFFEAMTVLFLDQPLFAKITKTDVLRNTTIYLYNN